MTKEEAIKVLEQVRLWTDYPKEAFAMAIEALQEPSLPSNLDKAAEKYGTENCNTWYTDIESVLVGRPRQRECNDSFDLQEAFKAGVKWEAEALIEWAKNMKRICQGAEPLEKAYQTIIDKLNSM